MKFTVDLTTMTVGQKEALERMLTAYGALTETVQVAVLAPPDEGTFVCIAVLIESATHAAVECLAR